MVNLKAMKRYYLLYMLIAVLFCGCQELQHAPLEDISGNPPKPTVTKVENLNGGAKISFSIPNDPSILYVSAVFQSKKGTDREIKSSVFKNYIELAGFGDTAQYQVKLYTVNKSEVKSEPASVTIKPLTPPVDHVFKSLDIKEDFGGINAKFSNEEQKGIVFYTMYKDEEGKWVQYDRLFSSAKWRDYSVRGLLPNPTDFAFYFKDEWGNYSDTLFKNITPLYEEMLQKKLWKAFPLPTDTYTVQGSWGPISNIWDGDYVKLAKLYYQATSGASMPNWFTIDLGKKSKFSRLVVFQAPTERPAYAYNYGTPRTYEIWGSNNPSPNGSYDGWDLILQCESIKPSGSPVGERTPEDSAYALAGENYNFAPETGAYRYIRFKTIRSWTGAQNLMLTQIDLFGQPME